MFGSGRAFGRPHKKYRENKIEIVFPAVRYTQIIFVLDVTVKRFVHPLYKRGECARYRLPLDVM